MEAIKEFNRIIDNIEARCMASEGPVTPTLKEMSEEELSEIWKLLKKIQNSKASKKENLVAHQILTAQIIILECEISAMKDSYNYTREYLGDCQVKEIQIELLKRKMESL
jgi:hypothetical protein